MIAHVLHQLAENPWLYDRIQSLVGSRYVLERLRALIASREAPGIVLDVGGGTGINDALWPDETTYFCLDLDSQKLRRYLAKRSDGVALRADATALPFPDASVDVVLCTAVTHHLSDAQLIRFLDECARVLRETGSLILVDALWDPKCLAGRLLWRYDVGSHPRPREILTGLLSTRFAVSHEETLAVLHRYVLWSGTPRECSGRLESRLEGSAEGMGAMA